MLIKGLKETGDHQIKIVKFNDNTISFLRDITCLTRIEVMLRLYEKDKLAQRFFKKPNFYRVVHIETEFVNQGN